MSSELLAAFVGFAFATLFTPGPNNIMLLSSGLTFGFRRTLPHVAGVAIGFSVMVAAMGFGFGAVFAAYPLLQTILKYAGAAYLIWLAAVIALARPADPEAAVERRPMSFLGAAAFQWVNVKGWVIAIGTVTAYAAVAAYPWNVAVQAATLLVIGTASSAAWAMFGTSLQSLVKSPRAVRVFNLVMAALLVASLYPVLREP
ncbi:LysE family translocator [Rhodopseudomonas palustris]|jgi:threonine/homoserine/homoserine lactone efflux protein|uniref:LysE family translocator n=1 Tax=Rhodopseudomonas TaxID=1073 RepID=UPI0006B9E530|nr:MULTISPECIES: LysE family translocator [Rhodopseudomonas]KPF94857.1 lysine transporter LysE [Rhodopseudomonas sp. AAP120]MCP9626269.1 LysE family translocator [Rhodopseudomonas palustris]